MRIYFFLSKKIQDLEKKLAGKESEKKTEEKYERLLSEKKQEFSKQIEEKNKSTENIKRKNFFAI